MKLTKFIIPIAAILMVFAVVEANAQICVYKQGEEYNLADAIRYKGDNLKFIKFCCESLGKCTVNYFVENKYLLTHIAAKYNRCDVLKYLVEDESIPYDRYPINIKDGSNLLTQTQIMMSSENGNPPCTEYLLSKGANVVRKNAVGKDAYDYAKESNNATVISLVKSAWEKAKGMAQANLEKNKKDLIRVLTLNDIKDEIKNFQRDIKFNGFFG